MFITFEGPEGSGKTCHLAALANYLREQGYPILATREPGGTPIGDQIRAILSDVHNTDMRPRTEILLFQASRAQLVEQVIRPHLQAGGVVLCDRYADSTLAYQGYGYRQFELENLKTLIEFATAGLQPDLTILLDLDVELGLQRRAQAGEWNRLDAYDLEFHRRVRQGYLIMAQMQPWRWRVVDATQPLEVVQQRIRQLVHQELQARRPSTP